jgi:hypothetical protein
MGVPGKFSACVLTILFAIYFTVLATKVESFFRLFDWILKQRVRFFSLRKISDLLKE